jgi:hypothetical protein
MLRRVKPRNRRIFGGVAYAAFLAAFVEVSLQGFYYLTTGDVLFARRSIGIWVPNEHSGIFNRPNMAFEHHAAEFAAWFYTNADGFRVARPGVEYPRERRADAYRIMLLGPSFAYGWGVEYEDSIAAVLERELEARGFAGGRDVEVVNAGVPSLAPGPHLRWYDRVGRSWSPDLVIQFIYGSMAVRSDAGAPPSVDETGHLIEAGATLGYRIRQQAKRSATVFYAWVVWLQLDRLLGSAPGASPVLGAGREMTSAGAFDLASPAVRSALDFYRELERTVRRDGTELVILYLPLSYVVHPEDAARWRHFGVVDVPAQRSFDAKFAAYLNGIGVPVVNVTPPLQRAAEAGKRLYYWIDIHWTREGNEVAAHALAEYLASRPVR